MGIKPFSARSGDLNFIFKGFVQVKHWIKKKAKIRWILAFIIDIIFEFTDEPEQQKLFPAIRLRSPLRYSKPLISRL